jgi:transposase
MSEPRLFEGSEPAAPVPVSPAGGTPRLQHPVRDQLTLVPCDLDGTLAPDHRARFVWAYVKGLDLSPFHARIRAVEGHAGRPPIDPAILMTLWLLATLDNVGSARALERLCGEHDAYRWVCGGVGVNHHTLAQFRSGAEEELDRVLSESVAVMMKEGVVDLEQVTQDGVRVRAEAGSASFRRGGSLKGLLRTARRHVRRLRQELNEDPAATSRRQATARERAATEREERVRRALEARDQIAKAREKQGRKESAEDARASTTDPDARVMKMADGGFRPAYNAQFCADGRSKVIVGVGVTNIGSDKGELGLMADQLERRYGRRPRRMLADTGFVCHEDIEDLGRRGTDVYAPVTVHGNDRRRAHEPHPGDTPHVARWRRRMGARRGRAAYRRRAETAEWVNARARNCGLRRTFVRGLERVRSVLLLFALAHNLLRARALARAPAT